MSLLCLEAFFWTRHENPDEFVICHDLHSKYIEFPNEFAVLEVILLDKTWEPRLVSYMLWLAVQNYWILQWVCCAWGHFSGQDMRTQMSFLSVMTCIPKLLDSPMSLLCLEALFLTRHENPDEFLIFLTSIPKLSDKTWEPRWVSYISWLAFQNYWIPQWDCCAWGHSSGQDMRTQISFLYVVTCSPKLLNSPMRLLCLEAFF